MPCYDERTSPSYMEADCKKREAKLQARLDAVTRVACEALAFLADKDYLEAMSDDTNRWWKEHSAFDNRRKKR